jgi:hypothetical protein
MDKDSSLVRVASTSTEWEASLIVGRLDDHGIAACAIGGFTAGFRTEAPSGVAVMVDSRSADSASQIVDDFYQERKTQAALNRLPVDANEESLVLQTQANSMSHGLTSIFAKLDVREWLILFGAFGCTVWLGFVKETGVLMLAILIIGPAIWLRRKVA